MAIKKDEGMSIIRLRQGVIRLCVLGEAPLIMNRLTMKAAQELLLPAKKKNKSEKESTLKHDPYAEFRSSPMTNPDDSGPTLLQMPATAFKGAMRSAALEMPGATKAQIGRLCYIPGDRVDIYGIPQMLMSVVRNAGQNKTPDIRSRCIVPAWACSLEVRFVEPNLNEQQVADLLAGAGIVMGVGDWRPEKGSGTYGRFELVNDDDPRWMEVMQKGRKQQVDAMDSPAYYDNETEELAGWFSSESKRRGFKVVA